MFCCSLKHCSYVKVVQSMYCLEVRLEQLYVVRYMYQKRRNVGNVRVYRKSLMYWKRRNVMCVVVYQEVLETQKQQKQRSCLSLRSKGNEVSISVQYLYLCSVSSLSLSIDPRPLQQGKFFLHSKCLDQSEEIYTIHAKNRYD